MWLFLPFGFFSIVQADKENLMVRARARTDLESLVVELLARDEWSREWGKIIETPRADYPFRIILPRAVFSVALAEMCAEIDYTNFKNEVAKHDELRAHRTYLDIWGTLRNDLDPRGEMARSARGPRRG